MDNCIIVDTNNKTLTYKDINTSICIGKNGVTNNKIEGDMKTPLGIFELGLVMGFYDKVDTKLPYLKINKDMYYIDDINSKYYNKLVNINDVSKDWNTGEHLIDYPIQYELLIEIKTNPDNIKGKGSAIFLHCMNKDYTYGCIGVSKDVMKELVKIIDKDTKIKII